MHKKTEFPGLIVGQNGIKTEGDRESLIHERTDPKNITDLSSFLGLAQFSEDSYAISLV